MSIEEKDSVVEDIPQDVTPESSEHEMYNPYREEADDDMPMGSASFTAGQQLIEKCASETIGQDELIKLRAFFLEKLTVKHLSNLFSMVDGNHQETAGVPLAQIIKPTEELSKPYNRRSAKRRGKQDQVGAPPVDKPSAMPKDMRFAFSLLSIGNFTIETPVIASREINCIKVCAGTSRLLYDTNFMLDNDWCSCVISIHLSKIEWISVNRQEILLYLTQPAIVEASYRNGVSTLLGVPNLEIENGMQHQITMRSPHDLVGFKTALMSVDPNMVHKFTAAKTDREQTRRLKRDRKAAGFPDISDIYSPQVTNNLLPPSGTSQYMVPQICPTSYAAMNVNNFHSHPFYTHPESAGAHYNMPYNQGAPLFKEFREPHYGNPMPHGCSGVPSEYSVQSLQTNHGYFVAGTLKEHDITVPIPSTEDVQIKQENCPPPPRKSIIEMALMGLNDIDDNVGQSQSHENITHDGQQWGAGASHLGYFDTPTS